MAASSALVGYGLAATWDGTAIEEVVSATLPGISLETPEATHMASDNTHRERIAGLLDGGQATIEVNYRPKATGQAKFTSLMQSRSSGVLVVTLPGSLGVWTATCYCVGWTASVTPGDTMRGTATFQTTGKPVLS